MTEDDYEREERMLALARGIARLGKEEREIIFAWLDVADEIAASGKPNRKVSIRAVARKAGCCNHKADELFRSAKIKLRITITEQLR